MPTADDYAKWTPLQMNMWSLQASIQSIEGTLQSVMARDPNQSVAGMTGMFSAMKPMIECFPEAAGLVKLFDRGPQG
jgi:hypothetical protein